jgi:hypothetical protein
MQTLVVDTNGIVKKLEQRGFSRTQAEGVTEVLKELDTSNLVTKADLTNGLQSLKVDFEKALHRQTWGLVGVIFAQSAFIIAVQQLLQ